MWMKNPISMHILKSLSDIIALLAHTYCRLIQFIPFMKFVSAQAEKKKLCIRPICRFLLNIQQERLTRVKWTNISVPIPGIIISVMLTFYLFHCITPLIKSFNTIGINHLTEVAKSLKFISVPTILTYMICDLLYNLLKI